MLQLEINERTAALDQKRQVQPELTPDEQDAWTRLSDEQRRLADLVLELSQPTEEDPAEDPTDLPPLDLKDLPELKDLPGVQDLPDLKDLPDLQLPPAGKDFEDSTPQPSPASP